MSFNKQFSINVIAFLALVIVLVASPLTTQTVSSRNRIQVGYCGKLVEIDATKAAGFDYIELSTTEVAALSDSEYESLKEKLKRIQLPVPVTYLFIPARIKITGPIVNKEEQMQYVRKALDRVSGLGAKLVVFGSGPARQIPEGFSHKEALVQLIDFCKRIGPEARARNITIAIEAQRKQECNIINNLTEGLDLITAVNDPNIQLIVDFYHMAEEHEDPSVLVRAGDHIRHVHMANPEGRVFPLDSREYDYSSFFQNLKTIGYNKRMSIEARTSDFSREAPLAIDFLKRSN
jgi:D-psicose/D-tagatose/L-ribulose 3-epimerase